MRLLLVDDDAAFRALLRTAFEVFDLDLDEADSAAMAARRISAYPPDAIVLDVLMPEIDGVEYCRHLKEDPVTSGIPVVLLTGSDVHTEGAPADAVLRKPFDPLELLSVVERVAGGGLGVPLRSPGPADDLHELLERERGQRAELHAAYLDTVVALASALESKSTGSRAHAQRVQRYATLLASECAPELLNDPSVEFGFVLHDIGKIGIPNELLQKPSGLTLAERSVVEKHTLLGHRMLDGIEFLSGACVEIVRSHHERWDGHGYPDGLAAGEIPLGARVFAVADALDAMTSDRPYRRAQSWHYAIDELERERGGQFDPDVADAFRSCSDELRTIWRELAAA